MYRLVLIVLFFISANVFSQSTNKIDKERYNFIYDSLSTEKKILLIEKESLLSSIDSLNIYLSELLDEWSSGRSDQLKKKYGKEIGIRVARGQVWKGMTEKMLEDSWGKPEKISRNKENWGTFAQWYYGKITYFFKNRIMTGWEEKK